MIPYDIDPSLHTGEPEPTSLDDGFSPPPHDAQPEPADAPVEQTNPFLGTKSQF